MGASPDLPPDPDRNLALELVRVTEAAAIAAARGVRYTRRRVLTQSLSMRSKSGAVRVIEGRHHAERSNLIRAGA
jgi:fructose-1,6-bisphosphatase/sedoheptulose 1,7-bisphosphatase-like protein